MKILLKKLFAICILLGFLLGMPGLFSADTVSAQSTTPPQINGIFNPDTIYPSEVSRLTINVFNPNTSGLTEVNWVNTLPDDLVVVSPVDPFVTGCGGGYSLTVVPGTNTISLSGATTDGTDDPVNPGVCSVTVSVTSFEVGNHTNIIEKDDGSAILNGVEVNYEYDANITLLVLPIEDPTITKSFTSPINVGETSQMEINIKNNDPNVALTEVELQDTLPAGMSVSGPVTSSLSNCGSGTLNPIAAGDTAVNLSGASIAIGKTCRIRVNVETTGTGTFTNTITPDDLTTYQQVTIPGNVTARLVVKNVELDKAFSPANFQAGGSSTVTVTITNPDTENALTDVTFTDFLPANLNAVDGSGSVSGTGCLGTVDTSNPGQVVLTGGTIPAGGSCSISATVASGIAGTYNNTVSCTDMSFSGGTAGCEGASATLTVYPVTLGASATKNFNPTNIAPGTYTTMRIRVTAPGDTDLTDFSLMDNLPANVFIHSTPAATQNNCGSGIIDAVPGSSTFGFSGGTIPAGGTCTLTVRLTSSVYGPHTNTIRTTDISNEENRNIPADVSASFTVRDISVDKEFASTVVGKDGITRLTITLTNNFNIPITDLAFTDILGGTVDDGIVIASPPNLANTCNGTVTASAGTQTVSLSGGSIPASQDCEISVDVQGKSSTTPPPGTNYTNMIAIGDVTGKVNGTTVTQNWSAASDSLRVGTPDFRINKKFDPILVTGDYDSTMTITLVNPLSSSIEDISFTDNLPTYMLLANPPDENTGTCGGTITPAADRKSFTFSGGSLPANGSCKLTIKAMMEVTGNLINTIPQYAVTTRQGATNIQSTSATLTNLSSVGVTKEFSPNPVSPGSVSRMTITVEKIGIGIGLTGLGLTDNLTNGLAIADPANAANTCGGTLDTPVGGTAVVLSGGAMPIGTDTCEVAVDILSPSTGIQIEGYGNTIAPGTVLTNEGYTNILPAEDTLGTIFDPPTGIKTFNAAGLPVIEWKLVWINNSNSSAVGADIRDPIPAGTTYIDGSLVCEARGSSSTDACDYDAANNEVYWIGEIGPDRGASTESSAANEVVMTFEVEIPDDMDTVSNQASALADSDDDGEFDDESEAASLSVSNLSVWNRYAEILPESGFARGRITHLPKQPKNLYNTGAGMTLEIPGLQISAEIVGVPKINNRWNVSWLGDRLGYLEGSAFPTWNGNSAITGHVYDADGQPGIFHDLGKLKWGDEVLVHAYGQTYVYEVRTVDNNVRPDDTSSVYRHEDYPWLTLITCRDYDEEREAYDWRVVVRAVQTRIY